MRRSASNPRARRASFGVGLISYKGPWVFACGAYVRLEEGLATWAIETRLAVLCLRRLDSLFVIVSSLFLRHLENGESIFLTHQLKWYCSTKILLSLVCRSAKSSTIQLQASFESTNPILSYTPMPIGHGSLSVQRSARGRTVVVDCETAYQLVWIELSQTGDAAR